MYKLIAATLIGCLSLTAALAQELAIQPEKDKAVVVFYRKKQFSGAALNFTIRANGQEICRLSNKRYLIYKTSPGKTEFTTVAGGLNIPDKEKLTLDLQAGKIYYVQGDMITRFFTNKMELSEVTESTAQKNLPEMKPDNCNTAQN
ncbi:DUF2846 domain-containing protein [Fibrella sp. WM1]|uniref:DUF2846 domain-containing protein n=1 Tax=Fibrella musci TaxID=3242485 RepID=UPI003520BC3C